MAIRKLFTVSYINCHLKVFNELNTKYCAPIMNMRSNILQFASHRQFSVASVKTMNYFAGEM